MNANDYREEEKLGQGFDAQLMRRLLTYLAPYKWYILTALILLLIATTMQLSVPYLWKIAIDNNILHADQDGLTMIVLILIGVLFIGMVAGIIQLYIMEWIGQRAMFDLRRQVFSHVQRMHLGFFDRNPSGRLLTRITSDVNALNELFASGTVAIIGNLFQIIGIVGMMIYISAKLSLVVLIVLPLLIGATFVFRKKAREAYRMVRLVLAKLNAYAQEYLAGISIVQFFVQEEKTYQRFDAINNDLRTAHQKSILYYAVFFPVVELIGSFSLAMILWYGGIGALEETISIGTLAAFILYMERFYHPLRDLAEKYNILQSAMASSERIFKLIDTEPQINIPANPLPLKNFKGNLKFENVDFAYNEGEDILQNISFDVKEGQKVALVGATGAGKTSTVSLICRFYNLNKGTIYFDGIDISKINPQDLRKNVGLVLQDIFLFSGSIRENITLGKSDISDEQIWQACEEVGLKSYLSNLKDGLDHHVGERGSLLSIGQKQLISFARALVYNPPLLILDEATSSVDNETELVIQKALRRLFQGRTSVVVAHRLSTIKEADKILVFHKGKIVERGKHEELLKQRGVYWRLYQLQYQDQEVK